ncbi:hypothetical protein DFJ58DRAFT_911704 [Suillus subalutaceus]|uniref:uncharacterized protein n=1 Tax=Suillus subalutaceus TaxID=48586 RepID=UPI001B886EFB|nr:uncharacterized protein DFJ58DRAFT_911704 [Suillus subalutaceus]KAG1867309.1 hypothetical protein DFJ58DRAFT_911704 [Suillus subalutaceus]
MRRQLPSHTLLIVPHRFARTDLRPLVMSEDRRPDSPPGASRTSQANVAESSNQPRRGIRQSLRKLKNALTKKLPKRFKRTSDRTTAVQNVETEGASSGRKVEDMLHPSTDNKHPTTPEIPSDSVNQVLSVEPPSQVQPVPPGEEEGPNLQLANAELKGACDGPSGSRCRG